MFKYIKSTPVILLGFVIIAELFLWNFDSITSMFYSEMPLDISEDSFTDLIYDADTDCYIAPSGTFVWQNTGLNVSLHNLHVGVVPDETLSPDNVNTMSCFISICDEGNAYPYDLPAQTIVAGINPTEYLNLYPYGKVTDLQMTFQTAPNAVIQINEVSANVAIPFSIQPARMLLLYAIFLLIWVIIADKKIWQLPILEHNKMQQAILFLVLLVILALIYRLSVLHPIFVQSPWPHHKQYHELTDLLLSGETALAEKPSTALMESANPYDTIRLQALSIEYKADYAYYDGNYYIYFGIVPALLFYLPCRLLTGHHLPNYLAGCISVCFFAIMVFALYREVIRKWFPKTSFAAYLLISILTIFSGGYMSVICRPDLYDIPITAANMFTAGGLFFWLRGIRVKENPLKQSLFLAAGSLSMALVAGCRPQMVLFSFLAIPLFGHMVFQERTLFSKASIKQTLSFCLPYILVAAGIMYYNFIRFDSPFDFGAAYSLTSNDMTRRGFNIERIILGLYHFFLQIPVIEPFFPFIQGNDIHTAYMGKLNAEYTYGGLMVCNAFLWVLPALIPLRDRLKPKKLLLFTGLSITISLLIAAVNVNFAGILQRYISDFAFGSILAAALIWMALLENDETKPAMMRTIAGRLFCCCMILQLLYSFSLIFDGHSTNYSLQNTNPQIYFQFDSWF